MRLASRLCHRVVTSTNQSINSVSLASSVTRSVSPLTTKSAVTPNVPAVVSNISLLALARSHLSTVTSSIKPTRKMSTTPTVPVDAISTSTVPTSLSSVAAAGVRVLDTPVRSAEDNRQYRVIELTNGLRCVLVSDPTSEKAAAAMDVNVGHFSDPAQTPGLAHFLEHMLFLGTAKYPDENSYSAFLNKHGGGSNAYTSLQSTNYYFDVGAPHLEEALDRFAQFFIAPLFTVGATEREMNAVDSENAKNLQIDSRRLFQLSKATANPKHPMSKFGTGNLTTLRDEPLAAGIDIRAFLLDFHKTYYSASIMRLSIVGRQSLDQLQAWATEKFTPIVNTARDVPSFLDCGAPFAPQLGKIIKAVPIKDLRTIKIRWPYPSQYEHYRVGAARGLSHLLGHEGPGSVFAVLKKQGLVNSLMAGTSYDTREFALFGITIDLTEEGFKRWHEVVTTIYQYIALVNAMDETSWKKLYAELHLLSALSFRFKGKEQPMGYATALADNMQQYAPRHLLDGGYLSSDFDYSRIRGVLAALTPANSNIELVNKSFAKECDQIERWYQTQYRIDDYDAKMVDKWNAPGTDSQLFIAAPNDFIADDFSLVYPRSRAITERGRKPVIDAATETKSTVPATDDDNVDDLVEDKVPPTIIVDSPSCRAYHKLDATFFKPRLVVYMTLRSPIANESPLSRTLITLYGKMVRDLLNEETYAANLAGLKFSVSGNADGLEMDFGGYNQKLDVLIRKVVEKVKSCAVDDERFELIKEKFTRSLRDAANDQPYEHTSYHESMMVLDRMWHYKEKEAIMPRLTAADLRTFASRVLSQGFLDVLIHGNISAQDATALVNSVREILGLDAKPLFGGELQHDRTVALPARHTFTHSFEVESKTEANAAAKAVFQLGADSLALRAPALVFAHLAKEPCYDQLRTKEQLGYLVWSNMGVHNGVLQYGITVQSSIKPAAYLHGRIEAWLSSFAQVLTSLTEAEFQQNLTAVIEERKIPPKTLSAQSDRYWREVTRQRFSFDIVDREVAQLRKLTLADVIAFYNKYLKSDAPERRKLRLIAEPAGGFKEKKEEEKPNAGATSPPAVAAPPSGAITPPTDDTSATSSVSSPTAAPAALPPVPEDTCCQVTVTNFNAFKQTMPLHPQYWSFIDKQ